MGQAFQLQVPSRITGVILLHGALDVDGVGTVTFNLYLIESDILPIRQSMCRPWEIKELFT
jgi:hypothetical protein